MKFAAVIAVLAFAASALAAPASNDEYKDLIIDVLTYIKQQATAHDPWSLPDIKGQKVKTQDLDLQLDQTNNKISHFSELTVKDVETDPNTLTATVKLSVPQYVQSFDYNVAGTGFGKKVSGSGSATISLKNFDQSVVATVVNPDTSLQISSLVLDYNVGDLELDITGLNIEGLTPAQVKEFVSEKLVEYVKTSKAQVEAATAKAITENVNELTTGKTLKEVAEWVKSLIHK